MDEDRRAKLLAFLNKPIFNLGDVDEKSLSRYDEALTHSSYAKEMKDRRIECPDNERLEFFGNFVLGFVVSEYLFEKQDKLTEGAMTKKMEVVSDDMLAEIVRKKQMGIEEIIQLGGSVNKENLEDSIIAGAFEALIGAIYLHKNKNMPEVKKIILGLLSDEIELFDPDRNYIGRLQEFVQKNQLGDLGYSEKKEGPDHRPKFRAVVKISGNWWEGEGNSKQDAKKKAAKAALDSIG